MRYRKCVSNSKLVGELQRESNCCTAGTVSARYRVSMRVIGRYHSFFVAFVAMAKFLGDLPTCEFSKETNVHHTKGDAPFREFSMQLAREIVHRVDNGGASSPRYTRNDEIIVDWTAAVYSAFVLEITACCNTAVLVLAPKCTQLKPQVAFHLEASWCTLLTRTDGEVAGSRQGSAAEQKSRRPLRGKIWIIEAIGTDLLSVIERCIHL